MAQDTDSFQRVKRLVLLSSKLIEMGASIEQASKSVDREGKSLRNENMQLRREVALLSKKIEELTTETQRLRNNLIESNGSKAPTLFTLFPDLPFELRVMIWNHALSNTQVIAVREVHHKCRLAAHNPHSALLLVNRESRTEALKVYKRFTEFVPRIPTIWTNQKVDCI
jgi:hypothetical protein